MNKNTKYANGKKIERGWYVVDAEGQILGRLASRIAVVLRGKHKTIFSPHVDCGDFVVVLNASKVKVSGKKLKQKMYFSHSGYPAGDTLRPLDKMVTRDVRKVIRMAVAGMLPKNRLGRQIIGKLKVYTGTVQPYKIETFKKLEV